MSLLSNIGKTLFGGVKKVAGTVIGGALGGPVGAVIGGAISSSGAKLAAKGVKNIVSKKTSSNLPVPVLPGMGSLPQIAGTVAGAAATSYLYDAAGNPVMKRRRRRKGISAKDLSSFKRVARLVDKFSKSVHHFRNFKKGS